MELTYLTRYEETELAFIAAKCCESGVCEETDDLLDARYPWQALVCMFFARSEALARKGLVQINHKDSYEHIKGHYYYVVSLTEKGWDLMRSK